MNGGIADFVVCASEIDIECNGSLVVVALQGSDWGFLLGRLQSELDNIS